MARKKLIPTPVEQAGLLIEFGKMALLVAEQLQAEEKSIKDFPLDEADLATLYNLFGLLPTLKKKVAKKDATFTVADTIGIVMALAKSLHEAEPVLRVKLLVLAQRLTDCLESNLVPTEPVRIPVKKSKATDTVYQFKITLLEAEPAIWRRIQVKDCTLDRLHEHIQSAMGWTNSHLHLFEIMGKVYSDPKQDDDGNGDGDSTKTNLSQILSVTGKRFAFKYEYDFGDSWSHEILLEETPPIDPKAKYPLCVEGERACPPEDCGGVWGYTDCLEAIRNPKQAEHKDMMEWLGDEFDPERFDAKEATKKMKNRLSDFR